MLRNVLTRLMRTVIDEAERNPAFETALNEALDITAKQKSVSNSSKESQAQKLQSSDTKWPKNRRPPAVLDPVQIVKNGEQALRDALQKLSLDELRNIVAEYGMDTGKLVLKWVASERVIDRIVEISITRAHKGDAFHKPIDEPPH